MASAHLAAHARATELVRELLSPKPFDPRRSGTTSRVGIEVERIGVWPDGRALRYYNGALPGRPGAGELLKLLHQAYGWDPIYGVDSSLIGFHSKEGKVSLEPGSQLEFSADPVSDVVELKQVVEEHEAKISKVTEPWGLRWVGLGINPVDSVDAIDVIPLGRYKIMTRYLGQRGLLATRMMRLTTSVQLNFDYDSQEQAIEMLRTALALTPLSYALFGNSAIAEGRETGFLSYRAQIWQHTDPARSALLPEAFAEDFSLDSYATYIASRPLMFVESDGGEFVPAGGATLIDLALDKVAGVSANSANALHAIRELFTEARLKTGYIEVRAIDGLPRDLRYAATAFWTGIIYCPKARQLALDIFGRLPASERLALWNQASQNGLDATVEGVKLAVHAEALYECAADCLGRRAKSEQTLLAPLSKILENRENPAQTSLRKWRSQWGRDVQKLIDDACR